jgi:hypothetical protein
MIGGTSRKGMPGTLRQVEGDRFGVRDQWGLPRKRINLQSTPETEVIHITALTSNRIEIESALLVALKSKDVSSGDLNILKAG